MEELLPARCVPRLLSGSFHLHAPDVGNHLPDLLFRHAHALLRRAVRRHGGSRNTFIDGAKQVRIGIAVFLLRASQVGPASSATRAESMAKRAVGAKFKFP